MYAGIHTADLKQLVQAWISTAKGSVQQVAPAQKEAPLPAEQAILISRTEAAPAAFAQYLMTNPFAILVPVDLLDQSYAAKIFAGAQPAVLKQKFKAAGKLTILTTQLTWVMGNISESRRIEIMFAETMATRAAITGTDPNKAQGDTFEITVPRTMEEWLEAQISDPDFEFTIAGYSSRDIARRNGVWVHAPDGAMPRIIVPGQQQEALIRFTHEKMFHLGAAKVAATFAHLALLTPHHARILSERLLPGLREAEFTLGPTLPKIPDGCWTIVPTVKWRKHKRIWPTASSPPNPIIMPTSAIRDGLPGSRNGRYRLVRGACHHQRERAIRPRNCLKESRS